MSHRHADTVLSESHEQFAERVLGIGSAVGFAALLLSLLVTAFWNPSPQRPQSPQLPQITVPDRLDLPTDNPSLSTGVPTEWPTFSTDGSGELPDVEDLPQLPETPEFPDLPALPNVPGDN